MKTLARISWRCVLSQLLMTSLALGQHASHGGGSATSGQALTGQGSSSTTSRGAALGAVGGFGWGFGYWPPYYEVGVPGGAFVVTPAMVPIVPTGFGPMVMMPGATGLGRGPIAPPPPPGWFPDAKLQPPPKKAAQPARGRDTNRAAQLVTVANRLFRGNNLKKAEERYLQASRFDPSSAAPLVGLAQVALVREQYAEAAARLRDAETVQPGWMGTAADVQSIYGEPGDFARRIARLESHLQVHPDDRDAWLVLGAEWFLSGRTARAADVFLRLNDPRRKPDATLTAFLRATNQE